MQDVDWIELWMLNRTIIMECGLRAIIHDVAKEHFGFWSFPEQPITLAPVETRIKVLESCVSRGLIKVYSNTWLEEPKFNQDASLSLEHCDFANPQFLQRTHAIATLAGHAHWESQFQPDWSRYWHTDGILNRSTDEAVVHVVYAGNDIYQELLTLLPDYLGADKNSGIKAIDCNTVFQYQVTKWKLLPLVKVATWTIKIDSTLNSITELEQGDGDRDRAITKTKVSNYFRELTLRQITARRILSRLSGKWEVVTVDNTRHHDTIAIPR
ncbi:hypothetical protein [Tuwongella immobilis]|uniref:Uncharacterized protein n=1 Tax=Tuwongella immobilis TaxID=692036 RepID=A0A6C2YQ21_9BACT|nr:hypothetical protein [Tuwongella immobilis]VIP03730.1 unnamed protein product [Tuwongella immobilis]VTS04828.1 unnamed protein product [Tuwongella immobilis]